jgi:hypothetical protein
VTEEELGLRQSPRRSLTTAYFVQEKLIAQRRRIGTRRRNGRIAKTIPGQVALF